MAFPLVFVSLLPPSSAAQRVQLLPTIVPPWPKIADNRRIPLGRASGSVLTILARNAFFVLSQTNSSPSCSAIPFYPTPFSGAFLRSVVLVVLVSSAPSTRPRCSRSCVLLSVLFECFLHGRSRTLRQATKCLRPQIPCPSVTGFAPSLPEPPHMSSGAKPRYNVPPVPCAGWCRLLMACSASMPSCVPSLPPRVVSGPRHTAMSATFLRFLGRPSSPRDQVPPQSFLRVNIPAARALRAHCVVPAQTIFGNPPFFPVYLPVCVRVL
ncbi:hypothetical protein TRVL_07831 [Trypanosoma vivax]|nr:hypothetical protein TRVL_07831 [Trypanosoma vivax]